MTDTPRRRRIGRPITTGTRATTSYRIDDEINRRSREVAAQRGEKISDVVERALAAYVRRHGVE